MISFIFNEEHPSRFPTRTHMIELSDFLSHHHGSFQRFFLDFPCHSTMCSSSLEVERTQIAKIITSHDLFTFRATELRNRSRNHWSYWKATAKLNNGAYKKKRLTTRYIEPGQGLVVPFGLINTFVSVSFTTSVNPDNFPASPDARRTFCNLNTTLRISAMVCTAYSTPAQLWNPAPLRLYDVGGRFGSMVVGLGNSLGWTKKKVREFYANKTKNIRQGERS